VAIVARTKTSSPRRSSPRPSARVIPLRATQQPGAGGRDVAQAATQLGGLHILVNSGSAPGGSATATGPIETVVDEDLLQDFNVKYVGALRCAPRRHPLHEGAEVGRIINISGTNARNAGNLSGGARNTSLVHLTKTLAVQVGRFGITVNCIHRASRAPSERRACWPPVPPSWAWLPRTSRHATSPRFPRGNAICRMVDAAEIAYVTAFLPRTRPGRSPAS